MPRDRYSNRYTRSSPPPRPFCGPALRYGLATAALLALGGSAVAAWLNWERPRPVEVAAFLVDVSDRIAPPARGKIEQVMFETADAAPRGDQIIVAQLTAEPSAPITQHFIEVAPDRAEDCRFVGCTRVQFAKERVAKYIEPFTRATARSLEPGVRRFSPLIEGIGAITRLTPFRSDDVSMRKRLTIVTDALQHSTACSVYPSSRRKLEGKPQASGQANPLTAPGCIKLIEQLRGKLRNTDVEILHIIRTDATNAAVQTHELKEALERALLDAGARQVRWREIR